MTTCKTEVSLSDVHALPCKVTHSIFNASECSLEWDTGIIEQELGEEKVTGTRTRGLVHEQTPILWNVFSATSLFESRMQLA